MTKFERLGEKCTTTICHKTCPVHFFNEYGAGKDCHNNCMESLRFPNVAAAVNLWIAGKEWSKQSLMKCGGDYDCREGMEQAKPDEVRR